MSEPRLEIRNIQTERDQQLASELLARCFSADNSYFTHLNKMLRALKGDPSLSPTNSWLLEKDGTLIGEVLISVRPIRVGKAILQAGGIGGVCTEPGARNLGYNKILLRYCLKYMEQIGLDISLLAGIQNYYHQYDYAEVMPTYTASIPGEKAISQQPCFPVRKFELRDLDSISSLYESEFVNITGTQVRHHDYWKWLISDSPEIYVVEDTSKTIRAYIWLEAGNKFKEVCGQDNAAVVSLLNFIGQEAQKHFQAEIIGQLHPQQPFARLALPKCDGSLTIRYVTNGGWMGRLIHLQSTFEKLQREFTQRLSSSEFNTWSGVIQFETDLGDLSIGIARGGAKVVHGDDKKNCSICRATQATLVQMIFGYISVEDLVHQQKLTVTDDIIPLLTTLFPQGYGYISVPDHF